MAHVYDYPGWLTTVTIPRRPPPTFSEGPQGVAGMVPFLIALQDVEAFKAYCRGADETIPLTGGGSIVRRVPLVHPDNPDLFLDSWDMEYLGRPMDVAWAPGLSIYTEQFSLALMRAYFQSLPFAGGGDQPYYAVSSEASATAEIIPGGAMATASGRAVTGQRAVPIPCTSLVVTTFMSPTPVSYTLSQLTGTTNSIDVDLGENGTFPSGTLRFDGVAQQRTVGSSGSVLQKRFSLKHRRFPWNQVINDLGVWEFAFAVSGGAPKYVLADLNILKSS